MKKGHQFKRRMVLPKTSFFLFGPRGTGKSTWIKENIPEALYINLLKGSDYLPLLKDPSYLRLLVEGASARWIVIDEVQKLPALLDEVHQLIFEFKDQYKFALTGSSARKLKRENANMLAGRARRRDFFPLTSEELNFDFEIENILKYGTLPEVLNLSAKEDKIDYLESYVNTYLKEEITQEAVARNLDSFVRFLEVSSLLNAQILNISNVARDVGVARTTVESYFSILGDTLLTSKVEGFRVRAKVKESVQAKLFFFDCGVARALSGRLRENIDTLDKGYLFETFILNELRAYNSYAACGATIGYWGTPSENEVDFIFKAGSNLTGIEIKTSKEWKPAFNKGLNVLLEAKKINRAYGVYWGERALKINNIHIFPVKEFCQRLWSGDLF